MNRYYGNVRAAGRRESLTTFGNGPLSAGGSGKAGPGGRTRSARPWAALATLRGCVFLTNQHLTAEIGMFFPHDSSSELPKKVKLSMGMTAVESKIKQTELFVLSSDCLGLA